MNCAPRIAGLQSVSVLLEGMAETPGELARQTLVAGVDMDSRRLRPGELFLAAASADGGRHGLDYLDAALDRGAAALVWEPGTREPPEHVSVPVFRVPELSRYVSEIAARFHGHPSKGLYMVGVTGTDGKTSCCHLLAQALQHGGDRCGVLGTLGYGFTEALSAPTHTTPDAVAMQRWLQAFAARRARAVAMEVSSHALDQHRADGVAFDVAVLTNISRDHLDYHADEQAYAAAKRRLFDMPGLDAAVLNADDDTGRAWLRDLPAGVSAIAYGMADSRPAGLEAWVLARAVHTTPRGLEIDVTSSWGEGRLRSTLLGRFNAYNLMAALAVLLHRGRTLDEGLAALAAAGTVPGRMEGYRSESRPLVVVDYAHTPAALAQALQASRDHCSGRLWAVFGCGGERDKGKRVLMAAAAAEQADRIIVTDDNPRGESSRSITDDIETGFPAGTAYRVIHDRGEAIRTAVDEAGPGDVVLVAGKGHESEQVVGAERRRFSDRAFVAQLLGQEVH